jgi:hypothetical protein
LGSLEEDFLYALMGESHLMLYPYITYYYRGLKDVPDDHFLLPLFTAAPRLGYSFPSSSICTNTASNPFADPDNSILNISLSFLIETQPNINQKVYQR